MRVDSPSQAVARGIIVKLSQNQSPLVLEPLEFAVVAEILNGFTGALAEAAGIQQSPLPTTQQLRGRVVLDEVQSRMLKAMLIEYVAVPTNPG